MPVHPSAIVDPSARIAESAEIGPYCIIGPEVEIGARTRVMANVYMEGPTTIGEDNIFFPYSTIGVASQDLKYRGERAETRIGNRNKIREFVTIHRGTEGGGLVTSIGDDNLVMAYAHIAHDVRIESHTIIGLGAHFAGHVTVGDWAVVGPYAGVHQFCRVGRHAMIGPHSVITQDVMPFSMTVSEREVKTFGANVVGLERRGFPPATRDALHKAFRLLSRAGLNTSQAIERIRAEVEPCPEVEELIGFIQESRRGVVK
ncbi:MAG TPA: acyl-ACP--UDP-N-acetylglucosamine O-acyltransferase [Bryobacteraceae bacterium]|nr:acyl-ACP--UDP-N-acetylglucosamine O-acyltransferase [Bryobacteraceae bacterium]HOL72659.1 acyl-ACP--UDP-N-acetylglucosamine O-acyltransferase [Bryobacteraceae bacterium]HOQ44025.1 acyl-ACP--UDP-N-acetylglucosamine O-acyltransferase [Bryobacteraceae bacterium]HPQ13838.1 acyl-ACP--UDP-N-acetylglucosamine O-acyltransferase [Bryobacteraceae bacterium]HPU70343.1 acyl-ACP--UDP-N-acetylglucosamine O-acyltransferase [Bryobacteraceae bacterium]